MYPTHILYDDYSGSSKHIRSNLVYLDAANIVNATSGGNWTVLGRKIGKAT